MLTILRNTLNGDEMQREIDPIFKFLNLTFEEKVPENTNKLKPNHPAFNDVWRRIDDFDDKEYIYNLFREDEDTNDVCGTYNALIEMQELDDQHNRKLIPQIFAKYLDLYQTQIDLGQMTQTDAYKDYSNVIFDYFPELKNHGYAVKIYTEKKITTRSHLDSEINKLAGLYEDIEDNKFSSAIKERYGDTFKTNIKLNLPVECRDIVTRKNEIEQHFGDMEVNDQVKNKEIFDIHVESTKETHAARELVCKRLEQHFGLLKNPKNNVYYISDGQGKYIPFTEESSMNYTFKLWRDKFYTITPTKDGGLKRNKMVWTKDNFYKLAPQHCTREAEAEPHVIGFKNCFLNKETNKIYELDYRFPRLPTKQLNTSFVYNKELDGGALQDIFEKCFDEETQEIILQYYGRAIFERGYTESQDILFCLGAGGIGKTTFFSALSEIFHTVASLNAEQFDTKNNFAFSQLPQADFLLMDELQSANASFIDKVKQFSAGSNQIPIEQKNKNVFNLPADYIPRLVCLGNKMPQEIYDKFTGHGTIRRFCIIFLRQSMLEVKPMTVTVINDDGTEKVYAATEDKDIIGDDGYVYDYDFNPILDENGNKIKGEQGMTYYTSDELKAPGNLEWFIQQVVLHYKPSNKPLLDERVARERAVMGYRPEAWVIYKYFDPIRESSEDSNNDNIVSNSVNMSESIPMIEYYNFIKSKVQEHLLEQSVDTAYSGQLEALTKQVFKIPASDMIARYQKDGQMHIHGIKYRDEPRDFDPDVFK